MRIKYVATKTANIRPLKNCSLKVVFFFLTQCIAFRDVNPVSPVHCLVIPRKPIPMLSECGDEDTEVGILIPTVWHELLGGEVNLVDIIM